MKFRSTNSTIYCGHLIACLLLFSAMIAGAYPLSMEQRTRLKHYLPNTLSKLDGKDPVHVVLIGDGNLYGFSNLASERLSGDALTSYAGVFLEKVGNLFFYTGGVKLLNPPPGGKQKQKNFQGHEITVENLAGPYETVFSGLQKVQSNVFLHKPDIVMIQYGSSDALNNCSTFAYRWALDMIVQECKKQNVDVIIVGPTPVNKGSGAMEWGISRPYTSAARGIAAGHDALFFDAGRSLIQWSGFADPESEAKAGMALLGDKLERLFHVPNVRINDVLHLNKKAHEDLGTQLYDELLSGEIKADFGGAGRAILGTNGQVRVILSLQNKTGQEKKGIIGALAFGSVIPANHSQRFTIAPFAKKQFAFNYNRPVIGKSETGKNILMPLEIFDEKGMRFSFVVEDGSKTEFLELPPLLSEPISVNWKTQQAGDFTNQFQVDWEFRNGLSKTLNGTYRIGLGDTVDAPKSFSLDPLGAKSIAIKLPFNPPSNAHCFQRELFLDVEIDGKTYRYSRELEATRDLVLGEKVHMLGGNYVNAPAGLYDSTQDTNWAPSVSFDAINKEWDRSGLYCMVDLTGLNMPPIQDGYALKATLTLDGRQKGLVRSFGAVSQLEFFFTSSGGNGIINNTSIGVFGNGTKKRLPIKGFKSVLKNNQITIKIPKDYLDQLDWKFTSDSVAGVGLKVSVADPANPDNRFPLNRSFFTNYPAINFKGEMVRGMTAEDPRGLRTLRFTRTPVDSWYIRIY